jgi:hypothetical protein
MGLRPHTLPENSMGLTEDMWNLIQQCWSSQPASRPSCSNILSHIALPGDEDPMGIAGDYNFADEPFIEPQVPVERRFLAWKEQRVEASARYVLPLTITQRTRRRIMISAQVQ